MEGLADFVPRGVRRKFISAAYKSRQSVLRLPFLAAHIALGKVRYRGRAAPELNVIREIQKRYYELLETDIDNAAQGIYPIKLLGTPTIRDHLRAIPEAIRQLPGTVSRIRKNNFKDLPELEDLSSYPPYYRRNFHWQTDGYLSSRSAAVYDLQTDWLFVGAVNAMRRQIIPIIREFAESRAPKPLKIIDIACGTGQTIRQLAECLPSATLHGCDLSPFYVKHTERLSGDEISVWQENAETLSISDDSYDVVTSTFLFHELPKRVRRRVMAEMFRVLKPGGLLVIEDSIQVGDEGAIAPVLENFSVDYHEPYYSDYLTDPLEGFIAESGFSSIQAQTHFLAKIVYAHKES